MTFDIKNIIKQLPNVFDHQKILSEYLALIEDSTLPQVYKVEEIFSVSDYPVSVKNNCPYVVSICEELRQELKFNFAVFRLVPGRTTFLFHKDDDVAVPVYHIPIVTNDGCFFVFNNHLYPIQDVGCLYSVNTRHRHNFINGGLTPRLHIHFLYDIGGNYVNKVYTVDGKGYNRL